MSNRSTVYTIALRFFLEKARVSLNGARFAQACLSKIFPPPVFLRIKEGAIPVAIYTYVKDSKKEVYKKEEERDRLKKNS